MLLLDYARNVVGLKMGGLHAGRHIEEKVRLMRKAGASALPCYTAWAPESGHGGVKSDAQEQLYEVWFPVGKEVDSGDEA